MFSLYLESKSVCGKNFENKNYKNLKIVKKVKKSKKKSKQFKYIFISFFLNWIKVQKLVKNFTN